MACCTAVLDAYADASVSGTTGDVCYRFLEFYPRYQPGREDRRLRCCVGIQHDEIGIACRNSAKLVLRDLSLM